MRSLLISFSTWQRFLLVSLLVIGLFWAGRASSIVGPASNAKLREAANLYSRVEELWRARMAGDTRKMASMMVSSSGEKLQSEERTHFRGEVSGPIITDFMVDVVVINFEQNLAQAQISFTIAIPGAPVRVPQKQTEVWEKVGSQWFYGRISLQQFGGGNVTDAVDVGVTDVVSTPVTSVTSAAFKDAFAPERAERFDRYRIAGLWATDAVQLINSGRNEKGINLLKQAVRIGAPLVWERMVAKGLIGTDAWNRVLPNDKKRLLELVEVLERAGQPEEAVRIIKKSLATYHTDAQLLEKLGDIYSTMGMTSETISAYSKAAQSVARSEDVHRTLWKLGSAFLAVGKNEEAVNALGNAAAADPMAETLQPVLSDLAHTLFTKDDFEHALKVYKILSSFAVPGKSTIIGRIRAAAALRDLEEVLAAWWFADTADNEVRESLLSIWPKLRRYITRRDKGASASYTVGLLAESLGEEKAARKAFENALSSDNTHLGSFIHLLGNSSAKRKGTDLRAIAERKLGISSDRELESLANALSREPNHLHQTEKRLPEMPQLFADGNLSRVILASGLDKDGSAHSNETWCWDGATLALDVAKPGAYFLSFEIRPFGLQGRFLTTITMVLDGEPIEVLPLQLQGKRFGKALTLSADVHSLQLVYDPLSLEARADPQKKELHRFALSHVTLTRVNELRDVSICEGGPAFPVDIVSISSGAYRRPEGDIFLDGEQVSYQMSGFNIAAIDQATGLPVDVINLAPAGDSSAGSKLKRLLESLKVSTIVAVAVSGDGAYKAKGEINESLNSLGAEDGLPLDRSWAQELSKITGVKIEKRDRKTRGMLFPAGFRHSYSLIGVNKTKRGQALEQTGWDRSVIAITARNKTKRFLDILSLCKRQLWSECARQLSLFFSKGNRSYIKRLPLHDESFRGKVVPLLESTDPEFFVSLGRRLDECSMLEPALSAFNKSISVSENPDAHIAKAVLFGKMNRYNAAHEAYISGASISPIPRVMHLKEIIKNTEVTSIDTIFVAASNGVSYHYLNGVRVVIGSNVWTLSAVNPETGDLLGKRIFGRDDTFELARSIDRFPNGSVIILAYSGRRPGEISPVLTNAINGSIRREGVPRNAYKNLVLVGYKLRKPRGFYSASVGEASLMVVRD